MSRDFELLRRAGSDRPSSLVDDAELFRFPRKSPLGKLSEQIVNSNGVLQEIEEAGREEIAALVTTVFGGPGPTLRRAVTFAGVQEPNTSAWVSATVAEMLASQAGSKVCLVDADTFRPRVHAYLQLPNVRGFADWLESTDNVAELPQRTGENLWVLTAGKSRPTLPTERLRMVLDELESLFDHIVVSLPCANTLAKLLPQSQLTASMILVIEPNTLRAEAENAKEELQAAGAQIIGAVLNERTVTSRTVEEPVQDLGAARPAA